VEIKVHSEHIANVNQNVSISTSILLHIIMVELTGEGRACIPVGPTKT